MNNTKISALKAGAAPLALGLAILATPAFAQDAAADCSTDPNAPECADQGSAPIIVTGSIFRRADTETASPVTSVTTENLDQRGIATVQDGLQQLAANNGPALTNSFSANGAFAAGASAVSLRGLSTNSTLVLFDGLRAAYYPLADDGSRNFVDLNTIPDDIVERVEVLRDGASSAYGADAIAGVVNIITKRSFNGIGGRAEAGVSERGDAATYRLSMTAGVGDLDEKGWNAYISGFYYKSEGLLNRDRGYPYNTDDLRNVCNDGTCGPNNIINGRQEDGLIHGFGQATPFAVRAAGTTRYQYLNGCNGLPQSNVTAADLARADNAALPTNFVCQEDLTNLYGNITPDVERFGVSGKVTAQLNDTTEAYVEVNFLQSKVGYDGLPATIRANGPVGIFFPRYSTSTSAGAVSPGSGALALPVYICANGVGTATGLNTGCDATNGTLNPYNPFASQGLRAQILGRLPDIREHNETKNRSYRAAFGINGSITDKWDFSVMGTAMHTDLDRTQAGYVYIQNFLNAIARGQYNFLNPAANSQQIRDYIAPTNTTPASSDLYQLTANVTGALMELPGGPLRLGVGGSIYYEAVDAPSANSDINGPTQRYFRLNAFGTSGHRTVKAVFAELEAPILPQVELSASGRYDNYSTGQDYFSPKVGVKVKPIQQVVLRGTFSKGFRIPSFGEANALPTTGFVSAAKGIYTDSFLSQYGCSLATYTSCPSYITAATYGLTTLASPNLQPEKSESFTAGILVEPMRNVSFTVDYYHIKKTGAITNASTGPAIAAYYNNQPIPAGFTVIADAPDINNPNARPKIAFVQSTLINSDTIISEGLDFGASARFNLTDDLEWTSELDASYIIKLQTNFPGGGFERYDGTLGNFNLTAGSGTQKWRGTWLNSLTFKDKFTVNFTANMVGGYDLSAMDQGTGYKDCGLNDGSVPCRVPDYWTFDLGLRYKVNDKFTIYTNVLNLFDHMPPLDPVTYGAHLYNPVQGGNGIFGRYFRTGVKVGF